MKGFIDAMLPGDLAAPKKQKHTIERVLQRLAAETTLSTLRIPGA
ncbi:hypothetical protein [Streptomyces sp. NPDC006971]